MTYQRQTSRTSSSRSPHGGRDFDAVEELADRIDHGERRQRPKRRVHPEAKAPTQLDRGVEDGFHQSVKPTPPLAQKINDGHTGLFFQETLDPGATQAVLHRLYRPERVLGDVAVRAKIKTAGRLLDVVANDDERTMKSEYGDAQAMLQMKPGEIVSRSDIVGQCEKGVPLPFAMIKQRPLADAQTP